MGPLIQRAVPIFAMNKDVDILNRLLGERLGYANGVTPRFAWMWSPDVQYYYRPHVAASWQRCSWADRLGRCWLLCQWRAPGMPERDWWASFRGEFPYPRKGMYYAHPETALSAGMMPSREMTAWYIRSLDAQIGKSYDQHLQEIQTGIRKDKECRDSEWVAMVQNDNPAFSKDRLTPALHGANVEFQAGI